jgi:hypothetical protein
MQKELANMVVQGVSTDETWDKLPTDIDWLHPHQ